MKEDKYEKDEEDGEEDEKWLMGCSGLCQS